ncbi:MAG: MarR family transcriptional regulator [Candidatus Atribacteria bacterium]|nr:MAG: MarR family transcriptional regulator [Candidatus Atribacteria bacterium]
MKEDYILTDIITILTTKIAKIEEEALAESRFSELTGKQMYYLEAISNLNNPNLGELATELNLSKPSITAIIDKFEEKEFIRKVKSDEDRRVSHIHMAERGKEIEKVHSKIHMRISNIFTSKLTKNELNSLIHLLSKIVK